jgi:hypothetical protein
MIYFYNSFAVNMKEAIIFLLPLLISPALGGWLSPLENLGLFRVAIGVVWLRSF